MWFFSMMVTAFAAAVVVAGILAFLRNRSEGQNLWFFLLCLVLGAWIIVNYADSNLPLNGSLAVWLVKLDFCLAVFIGWCFLQFTAYLMKRTKDMRSLGSFLVGTGFRVATVTTNLVLAALVVSGVFFIVRPTSRGAIVTLSMSSILYMLTLLPYLVGSILVIIFTYFKSDKLLKREIGMIVVGFLVAVVANILTNLVFPNFISDVSIVKELNSVGYLGLSVLVLCMYVAIVTRRLFDIRFFVVRSAAYLTTLFVTTLLLVVPAVWAFGHFLNFQPSISQFALIVLLSVLVLYVLQYLRGLFDRITTKVFLRHYYDPQAVLDQISDVLVRTADVDVIRDSTAAVLKEAMRPSLLRYVLFVDRAGDSAAFVRGLEASSPSTTRNVIDADSTEDVDRRFVMLLKNEGFALAVKLRTTHESLGYMLVGHKMSGEIYTTRDRQLLSVAADEVAISLQNALRFQEIQNFNVTLQERVNKATRQLRQTNVRLKQLDATKDDFISMASHQLRTPLTSVKGYLSMVLEGDAGSLSKGQRKLLEQAFRSSQQMVYLISDLLNLSRLNTGKFVIEPSSVDLSEVVQTEIEQLDETAKARGLTLTYNRPASFPKLMLDETKTHQVVMNFIDNAIYYTPAGGTITVSLNETPTAVEYTVKDTGIGVPKDVQHKLFTKFYRAKNAQAARPDGTGLGLFMAKKVVVAQGGSIIFDSEEGKGSTFGFRFNKVNHLAS